MSQMTPMTPARLLLLAVASALLTGCAGAYVAGDVGASVPDRRNPSLAAAFAPTTSLAVTP